ncbi:universal stress protein [Thalassobaculum litoreum]|uniref:Nucleotide-binding universal stress protein, UspA family n=1 Tax=Thalassobaculum litoreum DSM 18839 TaxID=1123362 RepID=A0A8G2EU42_9PROT|nr:universal stress protein [Thalassobaculum litoreum]SDF14334.1 Nucleotide-binding universal stress protein, UspA family [Thalassobaculum litoreum DSM 18839]
MAIKSILCHMANDDRHRDRLELAIQLTTRFSGHLDVLYNTAPVTMPAGAAGRAASNVFLAEQRDIAKKKAEDIRMELVDRFSKADCSHEYHMTEGDHVAQLAEYAHLSDLVVVSQAPPKGVTSSIALHHPEEIALEAGCATLVLPHEEEYWSPGRRVGTRVAVAWRNCKEASRAIREAMPFLLEAEDVHVFTEQEEANSLKGVGIGRYLSMHGVNATVHTDIHEAGNIGEQLLARAAAYDCDLMIMGAYSRARWRELLLGGVSEYVLHNLDRPVLMSH